MTVLYNWGYRFGAFVERQKTVLFFGLFLVFPLAALTFSIVAPSIGQTIFSSVCHQNPERSFWALPLCARCFGLYLGLGLAGLFLPLFSLLFSKRLITIGVAASLALAALSVFSSALDGNYVRLGLGLSVGAGFALLIKSILK